jgi:uncharacterized protein (DUF58 family)
MRASSTSLRLSLGLALLGALTQPIPALLPLWKLAIALFMTALVMDWFNARRPPPLEISRYLPRNLPLNVWNKVRLRFANNSRRRLLCNCHDLHPADFDSRGMPLQLALEAGQKVEAVYEVKPLKRGDGNFAGIDIELPSRWGLWLSKRQYQLPGQVKVYPNFAEVSHYILLATDNRLSQLGIKQRLRRGDGNDFLQLREYRAGDSLRQIDWKATSRIRKLISREYQDERDQQIVFLLDCGRRMHHRANELSLLDQTLNSMLLLAWVASKQGDAVGFLSFAGIDRWFAPMKGQHTVNRLLNRVYDIHSSTDSADYMAAASRLLALQRKRSLVIILTNTRDEDSEDLQTAIRMLSTRHRVILADLQEEVLQQIAQREVGSLDEALEYLAVDDYSNRRRLNHAQLRGKGAYVLDVTARQLPVAMVNQYLDLKRSAGI